MRSITIIELIRQHGLEREVFMELYRNSDELNEQMTADDCREVFLGILKGSADITPELIEELKAEYGV